MPTVCMYLQMHQPIRLRRYSVFDTDAQYYDHDLNAQVLAKVVEKCYEPTTKKLLDLVKRHKGKFRVSLSITGVLLDQLKQRAPKIIDQLAKLAATGCVEFLNETYYHSMAFLYSRDEFKEQLALHAALIEELFDQKPTVFRNTELIYNNDLAYYIDSLGGYKGLLAEGSDQVLAGRSANVVYRPPHTPELSLLVRNYRLSDDIAFRFSNRGWSEWPLSAEKYAAWIDRLGPAADVCNIFMDMETFGEHQWADTGIFNFLDKLPEAVLASDKSRFMTISEALAAHAPADEFDAPHMTSWADTERDLSAWLGNAMQSNALHELYKLEGPIKSHGDEALLEDWRRLTISDHFYYMCTKYFADGDVHTYFSPYESPYDSYINFMNVLDNLRTRIGAVSV
ncbi:MAG: polysaccharide deacetylase family protein [Planctomycetes bacterium]|nr:polysaccharide deacetylase family protein [Planctomycetota bacterium]